MVNQAVRAKKVRQPRIDRLRPLVTEWDWQMRAACRSADSALFYSPNGEGPRARQRREAMAKAVCAVCPVRKACLEQALEVGEIHGVWGGLAESERRMATPISA
ncbi:WhiB family transcriptional regulator [Rhodococcus gannanensis]|uniref:Transcriptional regulator WhiB n=1 Tax=Rhodococcus gannanensis TaxID=1960308 RepID=A0ABW4P0Z8_9NOCA